MHFLFFNMTVIPTSREREDGVSPLDDKTCKKHACAIQKCLAKRNYKEHLCQPFIDEWNRCREEARAPLKVDSSTDATI
jgi:hypothetical protein